MVMGDEPVIPCLVYYDKLPIGYIQYCLLDNLSENDKQTYCLDKTNNVYVIYFFIGERNYFNKGIGSKILSMLVNYIFAELQAEKIVIDLYVRNTRAIGCYDKCGFEKVKILPKHELHEGKYQDSWLMVIDRNKSLH